MHKLALVCAVLVGGAAFAEQSQNPLMYDAVAKAKAGTWAEYSMSMGAQTLKMRYALVERSDKRVGMEIDAQTPMGHALTHVTFEAAGPAELKMVQARMQMGDNPPQDMPPALLAQSGINKNEAPGKLVGAEKVTVPVGTFDCKHYERVLPAEAGGSTVQVWMSDKALPTGLVKMTDSRGVTMVLSATGGDAKAKMDLSKPATPLTAPKPEPKTDAQKSDSGKSAPAKPSKK